MARCVLVLAGCILHSVACGAGGQVEVPLTVAPSSKVGFTSIPTSQTGITFGNTIPESRHLTNQILLNGAGLAAGDMDGDGWTDLYLCATHGTNALYRNLGGWRFERVPDAGGAGCANLTSTAACFADMDGDGDLDLVVSTLGNGTRVFLNDGRGRFAALPQVLNGNAGGMTIAVGDVDGDGYLDLYLANYRTSGLMDMPNARATFRTVDGRLEVERVNGRPVSSPDLANRFKVGPRGEVEELGEPDAFYRNVGGTNFILQPPSVFLDEGGQPLKEPLREWGLCAMFRDVNGDGRPDLYVCNDFLSPDRMWLNQGDGRFRLAPPGAMRHTSRFSMAVDFADVNRDGRLDFFVADMQSRQHGLRMRSLLDTPPDEITVNDPLGRPQHSRNTLFLNRGESGWSEVAHLAGLESSEWSWSCIFLDVDLDGWEDLLVSNGMERAARDQDVLERLKAMRGAGPMTDAKIFEARRMYPRLATPKLAFRNRGDLTFEEVGGAWGFQDVGVAQAMALADLDNDGDLDVVVSQLNAPVGVYRNDTAAQRIAVRLNGKPGNTRGIGARIRVTDEQGGAQWQEVIAGGRYLAGDDPVRVFAAVPPNRTFSAEVTWRSGLISRVPLAQPNHLYHVDEVSAAPAVPSAPAPVRAPLFEDVSGRLGHRSVSKAFNDYDRQPLLPWKLSQEGPPVAWADLDADGDEDVVIGAGPDEPPAVFINDGHGTFASQAVASAGWPGKASGMAVMSTAAGSVGVVIALDHYEDGAGAEPWARRLALADAGRDLTIGAKDAAVSGAIALADIDNDGDLDVFICGRLVPGRYPEPTGSVLYRNNGGVYEPVQGQTFKAMGLARGCVFSDVDGDGDPDLVVACEWGSLRLFLNDSGQFHDATAAWGLAAPTGWWTCVAAGDFDGDGRMDLVAGNWGRNTKYQAHLSRPVKLLFGDSDGDGRLDLVEGWFDALAGKDVPVRNRDLLAQAIPHLAERFPSHRAFAAASLGEILGSPTAFSNRVEVASLESAVFLNRGGRFERRALPLMAQVSRVNSIAVGDVDGDGREDVFLAQNFFGVQPEDARLDAGYGLWLLGDGVGGFKELAPGESGVEVLGEQHGSALADVDGDGRLDLIVCQRGGPTRLYRNSAGRPGLRVRLKGPAGNPAAIGAVLRIGHAGTWGAAREVHAGNGSGSQDGVTSVILGLEGAADELEVRWPGGKVTRHRVEPGQVELTVP